MTEPREARVVAMGLDSGACTALANECAAFRAIDSLDEIQQHRWDVLVTAKGIPADAGRHLFVVAVGGENLGTQHDDGLRQLVRREAQTRPDALVVPEDLPPSIKELAKVDLLTKAESGPCPTVLSTTADTGEGASSRGVQAFLQTGEGEVLAGRFTRAGAASECWFLPEYADPVKWVLAALREWDLTVQPDARSYDDGPAGDRWLTPREAEAIHHREVLRQKIEDFLRDIRGQIARVEDELREAKEIADRRERRLLRARGQELLEPAHQGLAALGFTTEEWGSSEADERVLIVSDPEGSGGWQAVVQASTGENAPSLKDLLRLYRIRSKYAKNFGSEPSAVWCIFNRFPEADSSEMPELVATYPDEIAVLAGDGGLLLDTTALFDIWIAVQRRKVSAADARRLLITARGCLTRKDVESFTVEKHDVSHS